MKKQFIITGIFILQMIFAYAQPNTPSAAFSNPVKVFSDNGYYVKAINTGNTPCKFSFKYETLGYTVSSAAWAKYPVYTLVSTNTDEYRNVVIQANEERNLFTAPVDKDKKKEYYIRIIEVFNVEPLAK